MVENFKKISYLQTYCDEQMLCSLCPLKNIDGVDGCVGRIEDWGDEKVDRAYEIILKKRKLLKSF